MGRKHRAIIACAPKRAMGPWYKDPICVGLCVFAALLVLVGLTGCGVPGYISADALEGPAFRLIDRHDAYMEKDKSLSPMQREVNLQDGQLIRMVIEEAQKQVAEEEESEPVETSLILGGSSPYSGELVVSTDRAWTDLSNVGISVIGPSISVSCAVYHYPDGVCPGYPYGGE